MTSPRERPSVGSLINGWRVIEDDLQGRAGWVFIVCRDSDPERLFALKMWRGDLDNPLQNPIVNESNRIRAAKLPDILPTVIESGEWQGRPYFVMERLDDIDWPLPDKAYRRVAIEAFEALAQLHSRQILHCDITTRHLALKNGKVALLDLDNARTFEEALSNRDSIGTDPYIAPEVASRGELSPQSDIYSLAYVLRQHCPANLLDTLDPVFRIAQDSDPSKRPRTASDCAALLRTARPPHHRFRTVVKWAAISLTISILCWWQYNRWLYVKRQSRVQRQHENIVYVMANVKAGLRHYENHEFEKSVKRLECAVSAKHFAEVYSQHDKVYHILSECYRDGKGVPKDHEKSRLYERRRENHH